MVFRETLNKLRDVEKWDELVSAATAYLESEPGSAFALRALEQAYSHTGQVDSQAETWRRLVLEANEEYPFARQYAEFLDSQGKQEDAAPFYRHALEAAIHEKKFDEVEELWMTLAQRMPEPLQNYLDYAAELKTKGQADRAGVLLQMMLPFYQKLNAPDLEFHLASEVGKHLPTDREAREAVGKCYKERYGDRPDYADLLDRSGLLSFTPIPEAMEKLNHSLQYGKDQLFSHPEWGAGRVIKLDTIRQRIDIDFEKKPNHNLTVELAQKVLKPLDADDWRALKAFYPERGRAMAEEDPVALVAAALKSFSGKATGRDLKDRLTQFPIAEADWSKWWTAVNKQLKQDPHIAVTGAGAKNYQLREEAVTYEEEIRDKFDRARGLLARANVLYEYARHCRTHRGDAKFLGDLCHRTFSANVESESPATVVQALFVREEIGRIFPEAAAKTNLTFEKYESDFKAARDVLCGLESTEHQNRWLDRMRIAFRDEWPVIIERLFMDAEVPLNDSLSDDLEKEGRLDFLRTAFQECLADSRTHHVLFTWFVRRALPDARKSELYGVQRSSLLRQCFPVLDYLTMKSRTIEKHEATEMRKHAAAIRDVLKRDDCVVIRDVLAQVDGSFARAFHRLVGSCGGLELRHRDQIIKLVEQRFPDAFAKAGAGKEGSEIRSTLCLRDSLERLRRELQQILEVEMPQNRKDIDTARQHGDLSENAEYKAAKEKQAFLQSRATELQAEIRSAQLADLSAVDTARVSYGTWVKVRDLNEGGREVTFTILGPWESNPESGIISYKSAIGQALLDHVPGETVEATLPSATRRFEILEIGLAEVARQMQLAGRN